MERIENPMVLCNPFEEEEKVLEECKCCGCDLHHGDKYFKIGNDFYCEDCVDTGELDAEDYEPDYEDEDEYYERLGVWE